MVLHLLPDEGKKKTKNSADSLRQTSVKLSTQVPSFLWSADPNGEPTYVNQRALDYSGMGFEEFERGGGEAYRYTRTIFRKQLEPSVTQFRPEVRTRTVHRLAARRSGVFRSSAMLAASQLRDRERRSHPSGMASTVDIDEAKKAEDRLRRSETWLAQAQRLSHTGTWVLDGTTRRFLYWSDESYRIWGFDPLQGLPSRDDMWERIHPDDRERVWGEVQEALREKRDFRAEFRILLPDETVKYLEANTHHEFSPLGALLEVICTNVDVTERKYAEQALRESERKHRQLIESVPCHFWSVTPNGEPICVNQRLLDYFGNRFEDRKRDMEVLHPDDVAETERALNHAFQTGEPFQREHRLRRADGEYRWHRVRAEPQRDPKGQIVQWFGLSVDIDERKNARGTPLRESEAKLPCRQLTG